MKQNVETFSQHYRAVLLAHLQEGPKAGLDSAKGLGDAALAAELPILDLAKLHEQTLIAEVLPMCPVRRRAAVLKRAGRFFACAIIPADEGKSGGSESSIPPHLETLMMALSERTVELAASNLELSREIASRKEVEKVLRAKERSHAKAIEKSANLQRELRRLSRQLLSSQEEERKKISRELHDVIGQTLAGIDIHLAALKKAAVLGTDNLAREISRTQRLVEKAADIVNRFARELRPAVLDDLGLIPALHSFLKTFTEQTGIHTGLAVFPGIEELDMTRRTALFRVAQEALANVARHAHATRVEVTIRNFGTSFRMTIKDDGKSFRVDAVELGRGRKRLGLLGMRERVEMIGGRFQVESSPGDGTAIVANIPWRRVMVNSTAGSPKIL